MSDPGDAVLVERLDDIAVVRLNRPGRKNCITPDIRAGLEQAIPALMAVMLPRRAAMSAIPVPA